jgi:hypothetical protein
MKDMPKAEVTPAIDRINKTIGRMSTRLRDLICVRIWLMPNASRTKNRAKTHLGVFEII